MMLDTPTHQALFCVFLDYLRALNQQKILNSEELWEALEVYEEMIQDDSAVMPLHLMHWMQKIKFALLHIENNEHLH